MTNNSPKFTAFKILIKNKLYSSPDYNMLKNIVEANGFTVIEYKKNTNSEYVSELIKRLRVDSAVEQNDSFLYINKNLKFVFINSQISYEDKCSLCATNLDIYVMVTLKKKIQNTPEFRRRNLLMSFPAI